MHLLCSLFFIVLVVLFGTAMTCPTNCTCKWKGGKQSVECVNKSMLSVPRDIDFGTQVLDFSGNNLGFLGKDQFQMVGLVNLQKVFVARCHITNIDDRAFRGLSNVVELDLSSNLLPQVPSEVFADLPSLMRLNLNSNPLKAIKSHSFKNLKYLISLELSRCELQSIESDAFYGLSALELLKLDHNSLKYIPGSHTLPRRLHGIHLQHNLWFCDCNLTDLYNWLNITSLPQLGEAICDGPTRLRGAPIKQLDEQELACAPDVSPTSLYLEIPEGKNVSLLCRVTGMPEARVTWRFEDKVLQNDSVVLPGVHLYYYLEEGQVEKKSELFIFNANIQDNGTFVCVAENQAGRAQANYTIRIVLAEHPVPHPRKIPPEYMLGAYVAAAAVLIFLLTCFVSCSLRYAKVKRKGQKKANKNKGKDVSLCSSESIQASPITRSGGTLSTISGDGSSMGQKVNGNIFISDKIVSSLESDSIDCDRGEGQGMLKAAVSSYPSCYPYALFVPEQNPDLINDTGGMDRKFNSAANSDTITAQIQNEYERRLQSHPNLEDPAYASITEGAAAAWTTSVPLPLTNGVHTLPISLCFGRSSNEGLVTPDQILQVNTMNVGLSKVATHFPSVVPATATYYRTLPHKRHTAAAVKSCGSSQQRYARDAELMTRSMQPASFEHFHNSDIRYNIEGYPKNILPVYNYKPTPHAHVSFSNTVQILGIPSDELKTEQCKGSKEQHISIVREPSESVGNVNEQMKCGGGVSKLSLSLKNSNDSPDEGYVGENTDSTEV